MINNQPENLNDLMARGTPIYCVRCGEKGKPVSGGRVTMHFPLYKEEREKLTRYVQTTETLHTIVKTKQCSKCGGTEFNVWVQQAFVTEPKTEVLTYLFKISTNKFMLPAEIGKVLHPDNPHASSWGARQCRELADADYLEKSLEGGYRINAKGILKISQMTNPEKVGAENAL